MMTSTARDGPEPRSLPGRRGQALALALLALLAAFHLANNWLWRAANEVIFGADRMFHLVSSLGYYDILKGGVDLSSLFAALTLSNYYPPLVHLTVTGSYALFGVSADVAAMSNSLYLVLLLLAVYGIGERLAGPWIGLLSAALVSLFPIVFSMSRYLYVDFALASMVALNVCLLLRSEGFARRGYSLLYGLSFGLGMLVKWTFVVFALPPLLAAMVASPGLLAATLRALSLRLALKDRRLRPLLVSALLGLAVTALWFLPNAQAAARLPLGHALPVLSWLSWTLTFFLLLSPSSTPHAAGRQSVNLLTSLSLAATVAAAWYLTRIDFLQAFWANAYGKPTGRSWGFLPYLEFLYREQLSPLYAGLLLAVLAGLAFWRWRRTRSWRGFLALGVDGWALVLWVLVPYAVFSTRVSIIHSRYIMPLLPPLGLASALALGRLRPPGLRGLAIGLALLAGLAQFSALSFDALAPLQERLPLLAQGLSIQLPATGRTDPGFAVVPEVLRTVDEQRRGDSAVLGLLVNMQQVNNQHFAYAAYGHYPHVELKELAAVGSGHGLYRELFDCDFVLLVDPPPHYARRPEAEATIKHLLTTPDDTFHRAFSLAETYPLPDGQRLLLYARRFDTAALADRAHYEALAAALLPLAAPGDAAVVLPAGGIYAVAGQGDGLPPFYPLAAGAAAPDDEGATLLAALGRDAARLWVVVDTQASQGAGLLGWLAPRFYHASDVWVGPLQLLLYAPPGPGGDSVDLVPGGAAWQHGITLQQALALEGELPLGQILRLDLSWQAAEPIPESYKVFLHLQAADGHLAAQRDAEPLDGTRPTTGWQPGETIADRAGLWLPAGLAPGDYRLVLGLYDAGSGLRLPTRSGEADSFPLALLRVEGNVARILALPEN